MATKRKKVKVEPVVLKDFYTESEVELLRLEYNDVKTLSSFWVDGSQIFKVSLGGKILEESGDETL